MTLRPETSTTTGERRVLRASLLAWSTGFTALFIAVVADPSGDLIEDGAVARVEVARFVVAMLIGQIVARIAWRFRHVPVWRWWIIAAATSLGAGSSMALVDLALNWPPRPGPLPPITDLGGWIALVARPIIFFTWAFGMAAILVKLGLTGWHNRAQAVELAEARAAAVQAQLAMLRYQLNPHFLLNTLNAISTLVVTGRASAAEEMLTKLSAFLRASLAGDPSDFVSLDAELSMIQEYLDIESVRFGDRLEVEFACEPEAADVLVPSLILQPLVENAIKYAVGPSREPVTIKVEARLDGDDLVVLVSDDGGASRTDTRGGTGVGLKNVRGRLEASYGSLATLEAVPLDRGFMAIVRLPAGDQTARRPLVRASA